MEGTDVEADDNGVEPVPMGKSQKEIDDEIKKRKEKQVVCKFWYDTV